MVSPCVSPSGTLASGRGGPPVTGRAWIRWAAGNRSACVFLLLFLMFVFERERQSMSWGEIEREGDTESKAGSRAGTQMVVRS